MKKNFFSLVVLAMSLQLSAQVPQIPVEPDGLTSPSQMKDRQNIMGHPVVLKDQRLQPWCSYDMLLKYSMNFIKYCPETDTKGGKLVWYLVNNGTNDEGTQVGGTQNNQGGNLYWAMETFRRYYAYTGDYATLEPVKKLAERIAMYHTPKDFVYPNIPRTQDDTPDGIYDDEKGELDKACMVAVAYMDYYRYTGEKKWLTLAEGIAKTLLPHVTAGSNDASPLPYRVNLRTGEVMVPYTANMIPFVKMVDDLLELKTKLNHKELQQKRQIVLDWIMAYPMKTNKWVGYFEDVDGKNITDVDQYSPMETARYLIDHPEAVADYKQHVVNLIAFVRYRFGFVRRYEATSICEQDACLAEMGSHTARYASVVAKYGGVSDDAAVYEEARASFALATYTAYNESSHDSISVNFTGIGFKRPWFSDSYFDYLPHILDGIGEMPSMMPADSEHLFYTSSKIMKIAYQKGNIKYTAYDANGTERLKLTFTPKVYANGKPLPTSQWSFGTFRGVDNVLIINRKGVKNIEVREQ